MQARVLWENKGQLFIGCDVNCVRPQGACSVYSCCIDVQVMTCIYILVLMNSIIIYLT